MTGPNGCQATEDAVWKAGRGPVNFTNDVFTRAGHEGALVGKRFGRVHFCQQLYRHTSFICRRAPHVTANAFN